MSVLQDLSEEECYLFALFQDYSGIDIVEFCLVDEEFEGGFIDNLKIDDSFLCGTYKKLFVKQIS